MKIPNLNVRMTAMSPARSVAAGLLIALAAPPFNIWPLAIFGFAILAITLQNHSLRKRITLGLLSGFVLFAITLFWSKQFTLPGWIAFSLIQATTVAFGAALVPSNHKARLLAFPAAIFLADYIRVTFPFGGLPIGSFALGQSEGPLIHTVSWFGEQGLVFFTAAFGALLVWAIARAQARLTSKTHVAAFGNKLAIASAVTLCFALAISWQFPVIGNIIDRGESSVAIVQAGGSLGTPKEEQDPDSVFENHLDRSESRGFFDRAVPQQQRISELVKAVRPRLSSVLWVSDGLMLLEAEQRCSFIGDIADIGGRVQE